MIAHTKCKPACVLLERQGEKDQNRFCIAETGWHCLVKNRNIWRDAMMKKVQNVNTMLK